MCGIAGFISHVDPHQAQSALDQMGRLLKHRGPDSTGTTVAAVAKNKTLGLCHTLLSIIGTPSDGRQPFEVLGGTLVFNGAIYNYRALREELEKHGHQFRTDTDTEVLALGLATEGVEFLKKTRGMYAFGYWDKARNQLLLARDPFGVKPLYYHLDSKKNLVFASEYKAILPFLRSVEVDPAAVNDYLRLRYVPGEATLVKEIRKVPPGFAVTYDLNSGDFSKFEHFSRSAVSKEQVSPEELFHVMETAIQRRATADVEVAALLSGGIDSSVVCDILEKSVPSLKTYTLSVGDETKDESGAARQISERIGATNSTIPAIKPSLERLSDLIYHLDDPYGDPIILALDRIFSEIKGRQRVVVTGEGADELFSGYVHHRAMGLLASLPAITLKSISACARFAPLALIHAILPYAGKVSGDDLKEAKRRLANLASKQNLRSFLSMFFLFSDEDLVHSEGTYIAPGPSIKSGLRALREWDFRNWLPDSQLFKLDKISMASSIEAREPYVDQDLIAAVSTIPSNEHFGLRIDKPVFRKIVQNRLRIGNDVVMGRKTSFFQPFNARTVGDLPQALQEKVKHHRGFFELFLSAETLNKTLNGVGGNGLLSQKRIFALGALALWRERMLSMVGTGIGLNEHP